MSFAFQMSKTVHYHPNLRFLFVCYSEQKEKDEGEEEKP